MSDDVRQASCAFSLEEECQKKCAAYDWAEKGCTGYHPYCKRGKFYIAFKKVEVDEND